MVIWDIAQQVQIRTMRKSQTYNAIDAHHRDQRQEARADVLEARLEQIVLVTEALYRICQDRLGVTDDDLRAAVQHIVDEREAKASAGPSYCTQCGSALLPDDVRCQYCGRDTGRTPELFSGR